MAWVTYWNGHALNMSFFTKRRHSRWCSILIIFTNTGIDWVIDICHFCFYLMTFSVASKDTDWGATLGFSLNNSESLSPNGISFLLFSYLWLWRSFFCFVCFLLLLALTLGLTKCWCSVNFEAISIQSKCFFTHGFTILAMVSFTKVKNNFISCPTHNCW